MRQRVFVFCIQNISNVGEKWPSWSPGFAVHKSLDGAIVNCAHQYAPVFIRPISYVRDIGEMLS